MKNKMLSILIALFLVVGGISLASTSAEAHCGNCPGDKKAKVCSKCKKAGKSTCGCKHKTKACAKCKKAGKTACGCHKH